jgi:hypothetical protein
MLTSRLSGYPASMNAISDTAARPRFPRLRELPAWLWVRAVNAGVDLAFGSRGSVPLNRHGDQSGPADDNTAEALRRLLAHLKATYSSADDGSVDYAALRESEDIQEIEAAAAGLCRFDPRRLTGHDERVAFWVNLYNALTIHAVIAFGVQTSVLRQRGFFRRARYQVGPFILSLDAIEHGILRGNRTLPVIPARIFAPGDPGLELVIAEPDPRIHFALNCASRSCPPFSAYQAGHLDDQLTTAARSFLEGGGIEIDPPAGVLRLSKLLKWYGDDFAASGGVLPFLRGHLPPEQARLLSGLKVVWLDYDWSLNAGH